MDPLFAPVAAVMVVVSALMGLAITSNRRRNVKLGRASASDLAFLAGITNPRALQDVFGPPDMGRTWPRVRLSDVRARRTSLGRLIADPVIDYASIAGALLSLAVDHRLLTLLLLLALGAQLAKWGASLRLPG